MLRTLLFTGWSPLCLSALAGVWRSVSLGTVEENTLGVYVFLLLVFRLSIFFSCPSEWDNYVIVFCVPFGPCDNMIRSIWRIDSDKKTLSHRPWSMVHARQGSKFHRKDIIQSLYANVLCAGQKNVNLTSSTTHNIFFVLGNFCILQRLEASF